MAGQRQTQALHRSQAAAKASRLLGRLQEAGLVEKQRPPALSVWWRGVVAEVGEDAAFCRVLAADTLDSDLLDDLVVALEDTDAALDRVDRLSALVALVEKGPRNTRDVLGSDPSGADKLAWARLIELGIVVPSSYRWPTQRGVDLVASWTWGAR